MLRLVGAVLLLLLALPATMLGHDAAPVAAFAAAAEQRAGRSRDCCTSPSLSRRLGDRVAGWSRVSTGR